MFNEQIAKLEKAKSELLQMEAKLAAERIAALAKLPSEFGFTSLGDFIKALKLSVRGSGNAITKAKKKATTVDARVTKGKRVKITEEIKQQVKILVEQGKTGHDIASELGISAPSVQNIKRTLGMVKVRSAISAYNGIPPDNSPAHV